MLPVWLNGSSLSAQHAATRTRLPSSTASSTIPAAPRPEAQRSIKKPERASFLRTELFFGTQMPDHTSVSEHQFKSFLRAEITPRFPDGLTLLNGFGQYRDANGKTFQESSFVVVLLYPVEDAPSSHLKIERIRQLYKQQFQQQSVLRVDEGEPARVSF